MKPEPIFKLLLIILKDGLRAVLYFPLWWYGHGFIKMLGGCASQISDFNATLGFSIWLKNLFVPMFGQNDFMGRVISFFLRLVNVVVRGLGLLIFIILIFIFVIIWLILPVFILYQIFNHLV